MEKINNSAPYGVFKKIKYYDIKKLNRFKLYKFITQERYSGIKNIKLKGDKK